MAFGKRDKGQAEATSPAAADEAPAEQGAPLDEALFAGDEAQPDDAAAPEAPAETPAAEAAAPAAGGDAIGGDLLNMFQTTQLEMTDLSVVVDLAGDVDLADLLEELHTVAAALGCGTREELLAA